MESGETPEECAIREVFEETGLVIQSPRLRGILTFPAFDGEEDWYVFVFTAHSFKGELKKSCPEGDLEWIPDFRFHELPIWEGDRIFMEWLDGEEIFSGKFIYSSDGFQSHSVVFHRRDNC